MKRLFTGLLALALCAAPAQGKDDPARMVEEAEALARGGSVADAVGLYGRALRLAEKRKDLPAQELVTRSLSHAVARGVMHAKDGGETTRAALVVLLAELDPKRNSAFLCRGQAAHALLFDATATGETEHVGAAA